LKKTNAPSSSGYRNIPRFRITRIFSDGWMRAYV
jgi:hypothetical protein